MSAMAGDRAGFEEAVRALYADDRGTYSVTVWNDCGLVTTASFTLEVTGICIGDANRNNSVDFSDLVTVFTTWGATYQPGAGGIGDANLDGVVNFADIAAILSSWLATCP